MIPDWIKELPVAATLCDAKGTIIYMNEKSYKTFANYGGKELIGKSLYDCHSETSGIKIKELIEKQMSNVYTIEKNGIKKLIYQTPWYESGNFMGLVELSMEIPFDMPHFIRENN